ncbi:hypothetical protein OG625_25025 [Streptomyces sp. NBC_01351]|uniref:hypothetical protein n=1 Tax=Streptomyces sp. NBC_01351 TaxID=2903833 RepID=UPI002E3607C4|nr:hypothetical protein [Streptomyces sp. NBC_01351]
MSLTTPPRPLDVEALFPGLIGHRGTTTRLHPRAGSPSAADSHVGGPLSWPADERWPVCEEPHARGRGLRTEDVRARRLLLTEAWSGRRPTPEEQARLEELGREHVLPGLSDTDPLPMFAVAQLYRRDVPDLPAGPDGCDLLQVFWCPFDLHGPTGYGMNVHLRWRRSGEVREVLAEQPEPLLVGFDGYVPDPCVLHPEQVREYPYIELLPEGLRERVEEWEDAQEEASYESEGDGDLDGDGDGSWVSYQSDLSVAPGWKAGGFAAWNLTGPGEMDCRSCGRAMELLLKVDSHEWRARDGYSWRPVEERGDLSVPVTDGLPEIAVGNYGKLNVFACPADPAHPPRFSVQ